MDKSYDWNPDKNRTLQAERGISFEEIQYAIENGDLITVKDHYNLKKYPNQRIYYINIRNYVYMVPFVEDEKKIFLKTIIPSHKANKKYNLI